jgi:phage tail P2-like protein
MSDLLPPNATEEERALSETIARISDVPVPVRDIWNADTCPADILPWLAWAFSVDEWDTTWTEQQKRDVIKNSYFIHKQKGTIGAIGRALQPLGYLVDVTEWWQEMPEGDPYTFSVTVGTEGVPVDDELYAKAERLILQNKNLRSQLALLKVSSDVNGNLFVGAATGDGVTTTIYPG